MRRSRFAKLNIQLCAVALCAAGAVAGPAAASTLNTIFRTDLPGFQILGFPLAVAGGQVIDVAGANGLGNDGKLFVLTPGKAGAQYTRTVLHHFHQTAASTDGYAPNFDLVADAAGNVWGTTGVGGTFGTGTLFELVKPATPGGTWTYRMVLSLPAGLPAGTLNSALVFDPEGNLFGMNSTNGTLGAGCATAGCGVIWKVPAARLAGGIEPVRILAAVPAVNGTNLVQGLAVDAHHNLFGITVQGGTSFRPSGTVWEVSPPAISGGSWSFQFIYSFCSIVDKFRDCVDGENPIGGVVVKDGVLYGATQFDGGAYTCGEFVVCGANGVIYSLTPPATTGGSWTFKVVHVLRGFNSTGSHEAAYLVQSPSGVPIFSGAGALVLPTQDGGAFDVTPTNPAGVLIEGGVISIDLPGGGFSIVNNAFGTTEVPSRSGPVFPYGPLSLGADGAYYGASGHWNGVTQQNENTIYQVIP
jgi:hypothetical protein